MDQAKQEKIRRFLADKLMAESVREVLLHSFLQKRGHGVDADIYVLAAARIAIDLLEDGWKELEKYKSAEEREPTQLKQVGL